jgi:hypothetical protein
MPICICYLILSIDSMTRFLRSESRPEKVIIAIETPDAGYRAFAVVTK